MTYKGGSVKDATGVHEHTCGQCATPTAIALLSAHGGICYPCYRAFQRKGTAAVPGAFRVWVRAEDTATVRDMKTRLKGRIGSLGAKP